MGQTIQRILVGAVSSYVLVGTGYALATTMFPNSSDISPFGGPLAFLAWFVLPAALWPIDLPIWVNDHPLATGLVYLLFVALTILIARNVPRIRHQTAQEQHSDGTAST